MTSVDPVEQQFEATGAGAEVPASDSIPTPEPEAPAPPPPGPATIQFRGQEIAEDDIASLLDFQQWAQSNPEKMQAFASYLRGEAQFVRGGEPEPTPEPEKPAVDWDLVDPNVRAAYDQQQERLEALQSKLTEFEEPLQAIQRRQFEDQQRQAQEAMEAASGRIMERFSLSDAEMDDLADEAARLNIVPGLRQQGMSPQDAIETALETAFWRNEKWRSKIIDEQVTARQTQSRRDKAAKIGGTSAGAGDGLGSEPPVPATEAERRTAMAAEIAEALRGTP